MAAPMRWAGMLMAEAAPNGEEALERAAHRGGGGTKAGRMAPQRRGRQRGGGRSTAKLGRWPGCAGEAAAPSEKPDSGEGRLTCPLHFCISSNDKSPLILLC